MIAVSDLAAHPYRTAADIERLRADLDDVPAERIWIVPYPGTATEEDCVKAVESKLCQLVELVDGTLVEKTVGYQEAMMAMWIASFVMKFVRERNLGIMLGADGMHRMAGGNIREPDFAFIAWSDLPDQRLPAGKVIPSAPTLAVEVLSESNTAKEMRTKRQEYFASITRQVWQIDLKTRTIDVFSAPETFVHLTTADTLDGGDVLPGFRLPVAEVFAVLDQTGPDADA
ncbi:MAG TPA: Uma2 family endonuclease [Tepidisphaeraceae bacterium]